MYNPLDDLKLTTDQIEFLALVKPLLEDQPFGVRLVEIPDGLKYLVLVSKT